MEFQLSSFKSLKDAAVKVLFSICQQIWKTQQWPWAMDFHSNPKERQCQKCSNYHTVALLSHGSRVMLKILQVRLPTVHEPRTFRCSSWTCKRQRNQRSNCQHLLDHQKRKRVLEKHLLLLYCLLHSPWLCESQQTGKFIRRWEYQITLSVSGEIRMQVKKQQLELDMEQQTSSK